MESLLSDINELIDYSKNELKQLKQSDKISKVRVKNILENLRSALEYSAQEINKTQKNQKKRVYFPYGEDEEKFKQSLTRNLPEIESNTNLFQLIENLQNHKSGDNWLYLMCNATNIAKHNKGLNIENQPERNKKIKSIQSGGIHISGGKNITVIGNTYNGKRVPNFTLNENDLDITDPGEVEIKIEFEITENQKIVIKDIEQDLFVFLEKCVDQISDFIRNLYKIIPKQ
jgi:hypothetical protein